MDGNASDSTEQTRNGAKKRRPTERRKLQNRIAQKKYRENLKTRLEALERQAADLAVQQNAPLNETPSDIASSIQDVVDNMFPASHEHVPFAPVVEENHMNVMLDTIDGNDTTSFFPLDEAVQIPNYPMYPNFDHIFDSPPDTEMPTYPTQAEPCLEEASAQNNDFEYDFYVNALAEEGASSRPRLNQPKENERHQYTPWAQTQPLPSGKSPLQAIDHFVQTQPESSTTTKMSIRPFKPAPGLRTPAKEVPIFASELVRQLRLDDSKENQSLVRTAIARGYNIRDVFLAGLSTLDKSESLLAKHSSVDPVKNSLTIQPVSTLQAYISNAMALNITIPNMKKQGFQSPFYQPEAFASGDMTQLHAIWNKHPKFLRPVQAQITNPHHPWIDMIPFPTIRQRALTMSALDPPMIDILDFKNDVFMNSGIFCWRVASTKGTGQPWDVRSWEAEPWFLKKWWVLIGGEEGEVWEQTQWWRAMRGKGRVEMHGVTN